MSSDITRHPRAGGDPEKQALIQKQSGFPPARE